MSSGCLGVYGHTRSGRYLGFRASQTTIPDAPVAFLTTDPKQTAIFTKLKRRSSKCDLHLSSFTTAEPFIASLQKPRIVFVAVPAFEADQAIAFIAPHLEAGDILVDCTEEHFRNTLQRGEQYIAKGLQFVGLGISRVRSHMDGACFMAGCSRKAYACLEPILSRCSSQARDGRTVSYVAEVGSGKFCASVLAAIRCAQMQLVSEAFDALKVCGRQSSAGLAKVFRDWSQDSHLASPLMDTLAEIIAKPASTTTPSDAVLSLDTPTVTPTVTPTAAAAAANDASASTAASPSASADGDESADTDATKSAEASDKKAAAPDQDDPDSVSPVATTAPSGSGSPTNLGAASAAASAAHDSGDENQHENDDNDDGEDEDGDEGDASGSTLLEHILDTDRVRVDVTRAVEQAMAMNVAVPNLTAAVHMKNISLRRDERGKMSKLMVGPTDLPAVDVAQLQDDLKQAQYAAHICIFAQAMEVIRTTSVAHNWALNLRDIVCMWDAPGSVLCSEQLHGEIAAAYERNPAVSNLMLDVVFAHAMVKAQTALRRVVCLSSACGVPCPAFSAALSYFDSVRQQRLALALGKAHADVYSGCGFERDDLPGIFHL